MAADLLTLNEYLDFTGQLMADQDAQDLAQIQAIISSASVSVRNYCDRRFELSADASQTPRSFRYTGGVLLDIDDATVVNTVSLAANQFQTGRVLDTSEWFATAVENPDGIMDNLELYTIISPWSGAGSPEMGFKNNLDNYGAVPYPVLITVNAVWGWPEIPSNVKMAVVLAVADFTSDTDAFNSEAIAGYSRSRSAARQGSALKPVEALPDRALALLDPYTRINI